MSRYLILLLVMVLSACSTSYKPPPGWPDGQERPINPQTIPQKANFTRR